MEEAKLKVMRFDAQDVIATSGKLQLTLAGFGDGTPGNGTIYKGNKIDSQAKLYENSGYGPNVGDAVSAINGYLKININEYTCFYDDSNYLNAILSAENYDNEMDDAEEYFNGTYTWNSTSNMFVKE